MSNTKHLADLLKVCSILPALAIMPAMADLPNTTGNAWVFGDLNLGALTSGSVVGGRYVSINANKVNDLPKYKMVGRSVNLSGTTDNRSDVYVGPVELTLRELSSDEKFACNWQTTGGSENSNWVGTELDDGEKSMTDYDLAKKFDIEWGDSIETILVKTGWNPINQEHQELAGVLWSFANRDATKTAGALATNNADLTVDGAKISADSILLTNSTLNIVKQSVPVDFQEEEYRNIDSDGVTTFVADKFTAKDNSRILVGAGAELDLTGVKDALFTNNVITGNNDGGAINVAENGTLKIDGATFTDNEAGDSGGAIYNTGVLKINGGVFEDNEAGYFAGAIYNSGSTDKKDLLMKDTEQRQTAGDLTIKDAQFVGNIASVAGGAIYNEAGATVVLSGNNLFSGNVANKLANDIHNMGTLNITSGTTAFGGGVTGTGTFTLASDATLELGTATINQGKIDLYGTVVASMLNDSVRGGSYGRFIGDVTVGDDAMFKLNVGAAGTYNIWNGKIVDAEQVTVGDIYEIAGIDVNGVKIVTKSVADIAETVGISTQAAGAVAGLANANSGKAHQVSLALQDALNAGDVEYIERETKKLNPTEKPVAQAAASSVQNQVLSLTSGRMTGGISVGRAGGDERSQENGFWIQGLFNKSKFADAFHGYTRGVALGADTLINNKWTIGGGLAFNNTDVHADGVNTDIDTKTMFLYGQYKPNNWFVNATATYSMSEYTENKTVAGVGLGATYDVDAYGAQIMTGYDFTPGITTEAGLRYLHIAQDDYIDGRDAQIMATDTDFLTGIAGLKYAFAIENDWAIQLRPELRAAMTYDFISDDTATTVVMPGVEAYAVNGERLSRMGGEFGIGLTALYKGMEVSLMYDLDLHKDYTSQTGMIKFRGRF